MNRDCKCGGTRLRTDTVPCNIYRDGKVYRGSKDADPLVAHWKCNKCGDKRTQRKRQPNIKQGTQMRIKVRYETLGGHVHMRVFVCTDGYNFANAGALCVRIEEFADFKKQWPVEWVPE